MKKIFAILFAFGILFSFSQGLSQVTRTDHVKSIYAAYMDKLIARCESKIAMRNSKCINIRREAALYCLKAQFFKFHREQLIRDMTAEGIGTKPHQVHYYLNKRFFDTLREAIRAAHSLRTGSFGSHIGNHS